MLRKLLLVLASLALLGGLVASPAQATPTGRTVGLYQKCVVTKVEAKRLGVPRTKPGHVCAAPVRAILVDGVVVDLVRRQKATRGWTYLGAVSNSSGRIIAEVVLRPGPVFGINGWPRCVVTKAEAKKLGLPRTKPGQLCATPLRERKLAVGWDYVPTQSVAGAWPMVEVLLKRSTQRPTAYLVRRPG